MTVFINPLVV